MGPEIIGQRRKRILVIRHAHRDVPDDRSIDNGLNGRGLEEARRFKRFMVEGKHDGPWLVLSSPKKRCVQTILPFAKQAGFKVFVSFLLDEQASDESSLGFEKRVSRFAEWMTKRDDRQVILCSHGDWIPLFLQKTTGHWKELKKGEWIEISEQAKI